jgi:outer membrane lipoprotein-sorting protein
MPRIAIRSGVAVRRARRLSVCLGAAAALVLTGCWSAPRPAAAPTQGPGPHDARVLPPREAARLRAEILAGLRQRAARLRGLRGRAEVRLSAPAWGGASWMESAVVAEAPARLRLRAYAGPTTLFDVAADGERFWLYLPENQMVWSGPPEALPEITGFPGRPGDVVAALLGRPFGTPESLDLVSVDAERAVVRWSAPGQGEVTARFQRRPLWAEEFRLARGDSLVATLSYGDYLKESVGWWPRQVTLAWPGELATLALQFRQLELNPRVGLEIFQFAAPEGALRVEVGAAGGRATGTP